MQRFPPALFYSPSIAVSHHLDFFFLFLSVYLVVNFARLLLVSSYYGFVAFVIGQNMVVSELVGCWCYAGRAGPRLVTARLAAYSC